MDPPARLQRGGTIGHLVAPSLHDASGRTLDDAYGLVEIVEMRRQPTSWLEQTVPTAHFQARQEVFVEVVDEACARPDLDSRRSSEAHHMFLARNACALVRYQAALGWRGCELASRSLRGERDVQHAAPRCRHSPRRMSQPARDDDIVERSERVFAAFHRHDRRAREHRDGLADGMGVIREFCPWLERDQSRHEIARAVAPANQAVQRYARSQFDERVRAALAYYFRAIGAK